MATYQRKRKTMPSRNTSNGDMGMKFLKGLLWASISMVSMFIIGFVGGLCNWF